MMWVVARRSEVGRQGGARRGGAWQEGGEASFVDRFWVSTLYFRLITVNHSHHSPPLPSTPQRRRLDGRRRAAGGGHNGQSGVESTDLCVPLYEAARWRCSSMALASDNSGRGVGRTDAGLEERGVSAAVNGQ